MLQCCSFQWFCGLPLYFTLSSGNRRQFSAAKLFYPTSICTYEITNMYANTTNSRATPISTCTLVFTLCPLFLNEHQFCYSILFSAGFVNQYVNTVPTHYTALLSSYGDTALTVHQSFTSFKLCLACHEQNQLVQHILPAC